MRVGRRASRRPTPRRSRRCRLRSVSSSGRTRWSVRSRAAQCAASTPPDAQASPLPELVARHRGRACRGITGQGARGAQPGAPGSEPIRPGRGRAGAYGARHPWSRIRRWLLEAHRRRRRRRRAHYRRSPSSIAVPGGAPRQPHVRTGAGAITAASVRRAERNCMEERRPRMPTSGRSDDVSNDRAAVEF